MGAPAFKTEATAGDGGLTKVCGGRAAISVACVRSPVIHGAMIDRPPAPSAKPSPAARAAALGVHLFTASGAALGLLALVAAARGAYVEMFVWLGLALFVDGIDGSMARKARVDVAAPTISGDVLDLVVDYVTYVLVPAYALASSGLMPTGLGLVAAAVICVTSAIYFARDGMKTEDLYFWGFPAVWNIVAFYLFVLAPPAAASFAAVVILAVLTFAPIPFVHPFRVRRFRALTLLALVAGAAFAAAALLQDLKPDIFVMTGLVAVALYFTLFGIFRPRNGNGDES